MATLQQQIAEKFLAKLVVPYEVDLRYSPQTLARAT